MNINVVYDTLLTVLGGTCTSGTDCSSIANAECRDDGSGSECLCLTGYDGTSGTTTCTIKG